MSCKDLKIPRFAGVIFIVLLLFSLFFTGCAPPVGQLNDWAFNELLAVPQRMVYEPGDLFQRDTDLSVFTSSPNGNLNPVDIAMVDILIKEDPSRPENTRPVNGEYKLNISGRKIIFLSYQGLTTEYSIEVTDLSGGNGSGGGSIIIGEGGSKPIGGGIKWVY